MLIQWKLQYKAMDLESIIAELGKIKRSHDQDKMAKLKFILDEILVKV